MRWRFRVLSAADVFGDGFPGRCVAAPREEGRIVAEKGTAVDRRTVR